MASKKIKSWYNVEGVGQVILEAPNEFEMTHKIEALNKVYEGRTIVFVKKESEV